MAPGGAEARSSGTTLVRAVGARFAPVTGAKDASVKNGSPAISTRPRRGILSSRTLDTATAEAMSGPAPCVELATGDTTGRPRSSVGSSAGSVPLGGPGDRPSGIGGATTSPLPCAVVMRGPVAGVAAAAPFARVAAGEEARLAVIIPTPSPDPVGTLPPGHTRLTRTSCDGEATDGADCEDVSRVLWASPADESVTSPKGDAVMDAVGAATNSPARKSNGVASNAEPVKLSASPTAARARRRGRIGNSWPSHSILRAILACTAAASTSPGDPARCSRRSASPSPLAGWRISPVGEDASVISDEPARDVRRKPILVRTSKIGERGPDHAQGLPPDSRLRPR